MIYYFREGITLQRWLAGVRSAIDFEISPNGAEFGEEITRSEDFREISFEIWILPKSPGRKMKAYCDLNSLRQFDWSREESETWNPGKNSKIHGFRILFRDVELRPEKYSSWPEWMQDAPAVYDIFKRLFVTLEADEATAVDDRGTALHWSRTTTHQLVIVPYEERRTMGESEFLNDRYLERRCTALVFPELCRDGAFAPRS